MGRGGKGRPSKPTALKLVEGTRKDRVNKAEPRPDVEVVPPAWLTDERALAAWDQLAPDLIAKKVLTGWDVEAFAQWCSTIARIAEAERHLALEGEVIEAPVFDRNGVETGRRRQRSEWSRVLRDSIDLSIRLAARFGLTPADRASLTIGGSSPSAGPDPRRLLS